jgi:hypothetical protein
MMITPSAVKGDVAVQTGPTNWRPSPQSVPEANTTMIPSERNGGVDVEKNLHDHLVLSENTNTMMVRKRGGNIVAAELMTSMTNGTTAPRSPSPAPKPMASVDGERKGKRKSA